MIALLALASACEYAAESASPAGREFIVERLFTHDGCTVYRFRDGGSLRYFTRCASTAEASWTETCGKNCTRHMSIATGLVRQ